MNVSFLSKLFPNNWQKEFWFFVAVNVGLGLVFCGIWEVLDIPEEAFVYDTFDAKTYKNTGDWIFGNETGEYVYIRPFFYPLLIHVLHYIGGAKLIFFIQALFWFIAGNLTLLSIKNLTNNKWYMLIGGLFYVSELTSIALCGHALTETLVLFGLSCLVYFITENFSQKPPQKPLYILICLSLLAITKPIFLLPYILTTAYWLWKKYKPLKVFLCSIPVLIQVIIYFSHIGKLGFSDIGKDTFKQYYVAEAMSHVKQISFDSSRAYIHDYKTTDMMHEIYAHPTVFIETYFQLLKENIDGDPVYFTFPQYHEKLYIWAKKLNHLKYYLHLLFILPFILLSIRSSQIRWMGLLLAFSLLNTGLSFKQGDRLVAPSIAVWAVLYCYVIYCLIQQLKKNEKKISA
ncbi:MAG: hypothetical protein HYZ42_18525 [Bacteroidetes bacterium]|nr:hypothetical protein [Bacteroidota bacterium]